jgi:hypothetical protein
VFVLVSDETISRRWRCCFVVVVLSRVLFLGVSALTLLIVVLMSDA